jgi:hypothetical protein
VSDASLETIALLRVLHAINRHWDSLYDESGLLQTHPLPVFVVLSLYDVSGLFANPEFLCRSLFGGVVNLLVL